MNRMSTRMLLHAFGKGFGSELLHAFGKGFGSEVRMHKQLCDIGLLRQ